MVHGLVDGLVGQRASMAAATFGHAMGDTLAAIDVGTNSLHLVVARITGQARFEVLESEKEMVRLGHGGGDMKVLSDDAMDLSLIHI